MKRKSLSSDRNLYQIGLNNIFISVISGAIVFLAWLILMPYFFSKCCPRTNIGNQFVYLFFFSLNAALIASSIPLAIRTRRIVRESENAMKGIVLLLDMVSIGTKTGSTMVEALRRAIKIAPSDLLKERVSRGLSEIEFGDSVENAFLKMSKGMPKIVSESIKILIPASQAGGKAGDVLQIARNFVRRIILFSEVRKSSLSIYLYIALISIGIFEGGGLFLLYLVSTLSTGMSSSIPFITTNYLQTWLFLFITGLLLSFFSSVYVAKIVRGKTKLFSDYLILFLSLNLVIIGVLPLFI